MIEDAGIAQTGAQTPVKRMIHKALDVLLSFLRIFISVQSKVLLIQSEIITLFEELVNILEDKE